MKEARIKRYRQKFDFIENRISQLNEWLWEFEKEAIKLACYKAMQDVVDASMDIIAMILKDERETPQDDYTNVTIILKKKIINKTIAESLAEANGLRNRLVHCYNTLSDEIAYNSIRRLLPRIEKFLSLMRTWLKTRR